MHLHRIPVVFLVLLSISSDAPAQIPQQPSETAVPVRITVDPSKTDGIISPLIFGHNIEHTRYAVWKGISAEMLANRKFAGISKIEHSENLHYGKEPSEVVRGEPSPDGVAAHWEGVGKPTARFTLDTEIRFTGGTAQRIELKEKGATGGIRQSGITIQSGMEYSVRLWLRSHQTVQVSASLIDSSGENQYAHRSRSLLFEEWTEWAFTWKPSESDDQAQLEILFEGPCTAWVGAVSMMPSNHFHGMRRDVVELLKEMSVPLLRWPGGNFTRNYIWKEGLQPVDHRPPIMTHNHQTLPFTDNYDFHEIGIDEFILLCRYLDAEPSIVINITDSPDSAADWIEYCNSDKQTKWGRIRAERGHSQPYNVRYWSIGNENYGYWMGPSYFDSKSYSELAVRFSKAMRRADPSIEIIACGIEQNRQWKQDLATIAGNFFDVVSIHYYGNVSGPEITDGVLAQGSYPTVGLFSRLESDRKEMNSTSQTAKNIPISCDEWNKGHEWMGKPFDHEWHVGASEGMYLASTLNVFCREAQRLNMSMAAFFQPVNEGCITVTPKKAFLNAGGQVFKLFQAHHGNRRLSLSGNNRSENRVVDFSASLNFRGDCVVLIVANRHPKNEQLIELAIAGQKGMTSISVHELIPEELRDPDTIFVERERNVKIVDPKRVTHTMPPYSIALMQIALEGSEQ